MLCPESIQSLIALVPSPPPQDNEFTNVVVQDREHIYKRGEFFSEPVEVIRNCFDLREQTELASVGEIFDKCFDLV
ncbi:hypothetical protein VNO78_05581 [Psophocarpus tetragonolobus]|uniref:Uncharacterized protein n=1 Tax=Psophocarpus tetragonolobus TaxID=3891 RepID=A0AAN9ST39_PSOTE